MKMNLIMTTISNLNKHINASTAHMMPDSPIQALRGDRRKRGLSYLLTDKLTFLTYKTTHRSLPKLWQTRPGNLVDAMPPIQALGGARRKRGLTY